MASKMDARREAQAMLMHGIGDVLGYWSERTPSAARDLGLTDDELQEILWQQADRVAKLMGFEKAWSN